MATIPLAALHIQPPQQPDLLGEAGRMMQMKALMQGQQIQKQEADQNSQVRALQIQQAQQAQKDQQARTAAMQEWDPTDINSLPTLILKHGGSADAVMSTKQGLMKYQQELATKDKTELDNQAARSDQLLGHIDAIKGITDPAERAQVGQTQAQQIIASGLHKNLDPQSAQMIQAVASGQAVPTDDQLAIFEKGLVGHKAAIEQALKQQEIKKAQALAGSDEATAQSKTRENAATEFGNAQTQQQWDALRQFYGKKLPAETMALVPEQFSPQAAQAARQLGVTPEKQASLPDEKGAINDYLEQHGLQNTAANRQIARDDYINRTKVNPQITVLNAGNPMAGAPPPPAGVPGAAGVPSGEDTLKGMNPVQQNLVRSVATYGADLKDVKSNRNPAAVAQLLAAAKAYNPAFDETAYDEKRKLRASIAKDSTALNTATHHLDMLGNAVDALNNGNVQVLNKIGNAYGVQTGNDAQTNFAAIKTAVAGELSKVFKGGMASDPEIAQQNSNLNAAGSPKQLKGAVNSYIGLMQGRLNGLEETYEGQIGMKPNFQIVSPRAKQIFDKAGAGSKPASGATAAPSQGYTRIKDSTGALHDIPTSNLDAAKKRDPKLEVVQ